MKKLTRTAVVVCLVGLFGAGIGLIINDAGARRMAAARSVHPRTKPEGPFKFRASDAQSQPVLAVDLKMNAKGGYDRPSCPSEAEITLYTKDGRAWAADWVEQKASPK